MLISKKRAYFQGKRYFVLKIVCISEEKVLDPVFDQTDVLFLKWKKGSRKNTEKSLHPKAVVRITISQ